MMGRREYRKRCLLGTFFKPSKVISRYPFHNNGDRVIQNIEKVMSSRIAKGNVNGAFIIGGGSFIAAEETERRDLASRFMYLFCLLKEAQSPC